MQQVDQQLDCALILYLTDMSHFSEGTGHQLGKPAVTSAALIAQYGND